MGNVTTGSLDRQITVSRRVMTRDDQKAFIASWPTPYATLWARVREVRGAKRYEAQEYFNELVAEILIRYRSDVLVTDRVQVIENGRWYEIIQATEVGRHEGLDMLCRAIVP